MELSFHDSTDTQKHMHTHTKLLLVITDDLLSLGKTDAAYVTNDGNYTITPSAFLFFKDPPTFQKLVTFLFAELQHLFSQISD